MTTVSYNLWVDFYFQFFRQKGKERSGFDVYQQSLGLLCINMLLVGHYLKSHKSISAYSKFDSTP